MWIIFPKHDCGLYLEHNGHKDVYESVSEYTSPFNDENWVSLEEKENSIKTNELWKLQWYPDTPVGFHVLLASSLSVLLDKANK